MFFEIKVEKEVGENQGRDPMSTVGQPLSSFISLL